MFEAMTERADEPAPPEPDYDENGDDRTLIRAGLRQTPLECLQWLEEVHQLAELVERHAREPERT